VAESSPGKAIRNSRPNYTRESVAYSVPDIDLTAHDGTRVGLVSALGEDQSVMVNFVFTSCTTICPVLSASFAAVSRQLAEAGEEVEFLSISIDPEYDSQEKLAEYAEKVGAGGDWLFLTGSRDDILDLQAAFNTYRGNKMNHLPLTFLKRAGARKWTRIEGFPSVQEILVEYRNAETL
jgi:protein SCO1/2